jgi:hypothetical protein
MHLSDAHKTSHKKHVTLQGMACMAQVVVKTLNINI